MIDPTQRSLSKIRLLIKKLFPLCNFIRTWQVSPKQIILGYIVSSIFYLFPLLIALYSRFHITSPSHIVIDLLREYIRQLHNLATEGLFTPIMVGILTLFVIGVVASSKALLNAVNNGVKSLEVRNNTFRTLILVLRVMMFPFTNILTIIVLKKALVNPAVTLVSLLLFCFICWGNWCMEETLVSIDFKKEHSFGKIVNYHDGWTLFFRVIISNLFLIGSGSLPIEITLLSAALAVNFYNLYFVLFSIKHKEENAKKAHIIILMFESSILMACLVVYLLPLVVIHQNLDIFMLTLLIFSCWSVNNYINHRDMSLLSFNVKDLKTEQQAFLFTFEISKILRIGTDQQFLRGYLLTLHFKTCQDPLCFCSNYDDGDIYKLSKDKVFMSKFLIFLLETVRHAFPKSMIIFGLYCHCRLQENPYFSQISYLLKEFISKQSEMSLADQFLIYLLKGIVSEQIEEEHSEKGNVSIEKILGDEEVKQEVKGNLEGILSNMVKKYSIMSENLVRLDEVAKISDKINDQIRTVEHLWREHSLAESYSIELDFLFIFYLDKIIPSPLESQKLKALALIKKKKIISLEGAYRKNQQLAMYSSHACVLQSLFDESLGLIVNTSNSVEQVLGFEKNQLVGQKIHDVMPSFYAKGHRNLIDLWSQKQSFSFGHGSMQENYYVDKNYIAFSCLVQAKVHSLGSTLKIFKLIIRDNDKDYLILNAEGRIQGMGNRLLELGIFNIRHLHKNILSFANDNFLVPSRWEDKVTAVICPNNIIPNHQEYYEEESQDYIFYCNVRKRMVMLGDLPFWAVKFSSVKKSQFYQSLVSMTIKLSSEVIKSNRTVSAQITEDPKSSESCSEGDPLLEFQEDSSVQEGFEHRHELTKIVTGLKESVCMERKIPLSSRKCSTIVIFITILAGIFMMFGVEVIFCIGFRSTAQVIKETTFKTANNQIIGLLYNNILMGKIYCQTPGKQQACQTARRSNQVLLNQFYSVFSSGVQEFYHKGGISGALLHSEYQSQVNVTVGDGVISISSLEFLELFYNWLKVASEQTTQPEQRDRALELITLNCQAFKGLEQNWVNESKNNSWREQQAILIWMVALIGGSMVMAVIYFSVLKRYYGMGVSNKQEMLKLYQNIGKKTALSFQNYFSNISIENTKLHYPREEHKDFHDGMMPANPKRTRFIIFMIFFTIASPFYLISIFEPFSLFQPAQKTIQLINDLTWSQNHLIQSYLQVKTFYMTYNLSKTELQMQTDVIQYLNQTELTITNIIKQTVKSFSPSDPMINKDLNDLLTNNVCILARSELSQWEYDYCQKLIDTGYLQKGTLTALYALQRKSLQALQALSQQGSDRQTYFLHPLYVYIDDSLVYISKMYRMIEKRIVEHIQKQIDDHIVFLTLINVLDGVMCIVLLTYWVVSSKMEEEEASNIYGYVLQMPEWIITKKRVVKKLKEVLHLSIQ